MRREALRVALIALVALSVPLGCGREAASGREPPPLPLEAGPLPAAGVAGEATRNVRLLLPGDGDDYLVEPGIPLQDQTIPIRALAPPGVTRLEVRTSDGTVHTIGAPFVSRLPAPPGRHRVELWIPGSPTPAAVSEYRVR